MAEINFNNLYNQLTPMQKDQYDGVFGSSGFKNKYAQNPDSSLVTQNSNYQKFKAIADAEQQVPEESFISSAMSALNPFSELSAAEMPQVPNVSLGTPQINFNTGITGASSAIPNINGVPMINTGAYNQKLQNTDLVSQIIAANQAANVNRFTNTVAPFTGNQVSQVNSQVPFNDYYGPNIDTSFGVANEEDEEQQFSLKDSLSNLGRKTGISSLIGMITGNPIYGLIGKGIGALNERSSFVGPKGSTGYGNDSAMSLFRRSNTGAQFFQGLRDKKAREDAAARGAAKANMAGARAITNRISSAPVSNQDRGRGGGGGGGTGSVGRGGASPGSAGRGGSDSMGSF